MLRPKDRARAGNIIVALRRFHAHDLPLPGIQAKESREVFVEQLLESIHRVEFVSRIRERQSARIARTRSTKHLIHSRQRFSISASAI